MTKPCKVTIILDNFGLDTDAADIRREVFDLIRRDLEGTGLDIYVADKDSIHLFVEAIP